MQWTLQSGPGTPTWPLSDSNQRSTHVVFPVAGTYVLRLTANDSALASSDDVTVTVNAPVPPVALATVGVLVVLVTDTTL